MDFALQPTHELRFWGTEVIVQVQSGEVEFHGARLLRNQTYVLSSGCLVTWHGGACVHLDNYTYAYVEYGNTSHLLTILNVAAALCIQAQKAQSIQKQGEHIQGPIALVCGINAFAFCKTVANYLVRKKQPFLLTDLDDEYNSITLLPNTIASAFINKPWLDYVEPPLTYFVDKSNGYKMACCQQLKIQMQKHPKNHGWILHSNTKSIMDMISLFQPDVVFVLGDSLLHHQLKTNTQIPSQIVICYLQASEGLLSAVKKPIFQEQTMPLQLPHSTTNRLVQISEMPETCLPLDQQRLQPFHVTDVVLNPNHRYFGAVLQDTTLPSPVDQFVCLISTLDGYVLLCDKQPKENQTIQIRRIRTQQGS